MTVTTWSTLLRHSVLRRSSEYEFRQLLQSAKQNLNPSSVELAKAYFECREKFCVQGDLLLQRYAIVLLTCNAVKLSDLLVIAAHHWNEEKALHRNDQGLLHVLIEYLIPTKLADLHDKRLSLLLASRWLLAVSQLTTQTNQLLQLDLLEALGMLVATLAGNEIVKLISPSKTKGENRDSALHRTVLDAIQASLPLLPPSAIQLCDLLTVLLAELRQVSVTRPSTKAITALELNSSVLDQQIRPGWTALVAYLDVTVSIISFEANIANLAKLRQHCNLDEKALLLFLNGRHAVRSSIYKIATLIYPGQQCIHVW